mmetsp:Transcript_5687/g.14197  ORF Transcript_5687/g.14197 Transcript_5687/m.14197 type:complete len:232 (-) Transcript_5687:115-810(-)
MRTKSRLFPRTARFRPVSAPCSRHCSPFQIRQRVDSESPLRLLPRATRDSQRGIRPWSAARRLCSLLKDAWSFAAAGGGAGGRAVSAAAAAACRLRLRGGPRAANLARQNVPARLFVDAAAGPRLWQWWLSRDLVRSPRRWMSPRRWLSRPPLLGRRRPRVEIQAQPQLPDDRRQNYYWAASFQREAATEGGRSESRPRAQGGSSSKQQAERRNWLQRVRRAALAALERRD